MKYLRVPVAVASFSLVALGGSVTTAAATALPPAPRLVRLAVPASAASLPVFVRGTHLRGLERIVFHAPNGQRYAMAHGYRLRGERLEFWTPALPPGRYWVAVEGRTGTSNPRPLRIFATARLRAGGHCPAIWNNYAVRGAAGVWITCSSGVWATPTSAPTPTAGSASTATLPSVPAAPQGPVATTPPAVAVTGAGGGSTPAPGGGGGTTSGTVYTTMTLQQSDVSGGALGGEVKNFTLTLEPSDPNALYDTGTVTLGCATVSDNTVHFSVIGSAKQPVVRTLAATNAGSVTLSVEGFSFSHTAPTCGADPVGGPFTLYVRYSGGTAAGVTYAPDTFCAVPVVPENPQATATNTQVVDNTAGCPDTGPATSLPAPNGAPTIGTRFSVTTEHTSGAALGGTSETLDVTLTPSVADATYPPGSTVSVANSNPACGSPVSGAVTTTATGTAVVEGLAWSQANNPLTCDNTLVIRYAGGSANQGGASASFAPDSWTIPVNTGPGTQTLTQPA